MHTTSSETSRAVDKFKFNLIHITKHRNQTKWHWKSYLAKASMCLGQSIFPASIFSYITNGFSSKNGGYLQHGKTTNFVVKILSNWSLQQLWHLACLLYTVQYQYFEVSYISYLLANNLPKWVIQFVLRYKASKSIASRSAISVV